VLVRLDPARQLGFTLIELLIVIVILGVLMGLALPTYRLWIQNLQIRNAAESIQNGLQLARAEAVKRNTNVDFVLVGIAVDPANPANSGNAGVATGPNWIVRVADPTGAYATPTNFYIQGRAITEGSRNATITTAPATPVFTFSSLGRITPAPAGPSITISVDNLNLPAADRRPLQVQVTAGGQIRMCDPSPLLSPTDPRRC
jgi:type IV fimbrial biogenesis protein FimT